MLRTLLLLRQRYITAPSERLAVLMKNYQALEAKYFLQVSFPRATILQLYTFPSDNLVNFIDQPFFVAFDFPNQNCVLGLFFKLLLFN